MGQVAVKEVFPDSNARILFGSGTQTAALAAIGYLGSSQVQID